MKQQKNYDKKVKLTRILLSDYLVLKRISQVAGISMSEALHRLIEHQAQLPLPEFRVTGVPSSVAAGVPSSVAAGVPSSVAAGIMPINPIVKLRVTVAKGGSTNGRAKQV
ncbi:hypothetical protein ES703_123717 [subsurface metagenome]